MRLFRPAVILILFSITYRTESLWIYPEPEGSKPTWLPAIRLEYFDPPASPGFWNNKTFSGELLYVTDADPSIDFADKIVLFDGPQGTDNEWTVKQLVGRGAMAMIVIYGTDSAFPGAGNWVRDGTKVVDHDFPVFEITQRQNNSLAPFYVNGSGTIPNVTLDYEPNPWVPTFNIALPIVGMTILIFSSCIAVFAIWKLMLLIMTQGFKLSVGQVVLWLNVFGALLRCIWCAGDAFESYGTINFMFSQIMISISYPFAMGGALLIALYWHEMIAKTGDRVNMFLNKMKWPFFGWCIFMIIFELGTDVSRGLYYNFEALIYIDAFIYVIVALTILVFLIVSRIRLQLVFDEINKRLNTSKSERLTVATGHFYVIVAMLALWMCFFIFFGTTTASWTPVGYPITWFLYYVVIQVLCLFQVLLIKAPPVTPYDVYRAIRYNEKLFSVFNTMGSTLSFQATVDSSADHHEGDLSKS